MTVAQLGLAVDSSKVAAATPALERMTAASQKAEAAAGGLARASSSTSGTMKQLMSVVQSIERDLTVLVNRSLEAGQGLARAGAGAAAAGAGIARVGQNVKAMGGSFSGLAAQFQDIGVTAAMGMNPLQVALQQGTQIAGQMEMAMQGGAKASAVLMQGLASLVSPLSLTIIGITALAVAGLQMVDWTKLAKSALNLLADNLVVIAPYALAAAAALTLLYAPAIIAGIGSLATAIWGIGTAILATVGLPALLIAGFIALVAAAVVWRDDLTRILGVDIVGVAKDSVNMLIGMFVGAYNAVKQAWSNLPTFFSALGKQAWNEFIAEFEKPALTINGQVIIPGLDLSGMKSQLTDAEQNAFKDASATFNQSLKTDYVGDAITTIQSGASGAADKLRELASGINLVSEADKKAAKEARRQSEAYADITRGADQRIAAAELEMRTLGMTTEQIDAQRYAQELLNKAANDNIDLTQGQISELTGLGAAMAAAEAAARSLREIYDLGKETFRGFFSDLKSGLEEGKGIWASLADAAVNALQRIADKALSMAADGIWNMIFGAISSGLFGGGATGGAWNGGLWGSAIFNAQGNVFQSSGLHRHANTVVDRPTVFPFAKGIGLMGEAGPEAIMPLKRTASGALGVQVANGNSPQAANSNGPIEIHNTFHIGADTNPEAAPAIAREVTRQMRSQFPDMMRQYERNPLRRVGGAK